MDFQDALEYGYYFDRCIDLVFYNSLMEPIAYLKTPKRGLKPTITIKGILIEGGYSIDSYISIQNMAFDVDVAYVSFIKARMYYAGLEETAVVNDTTTKMGRGHVIMYKVLYTDQEKEPPNRCVRFQCVVAAKDYTLVNSKLYVTGGSANLLEENEDYNSLAEEQTSKPEKGTPLKTICEELINIYNKSITLNNEDSQNIKELKDNIKITYLEIDSDLEEFPILLTPGEKTLKKYIRDLNSYSTESSDGKFSYSPFKIVIDRGSMRVSKPLPDNWKEIALSEGYSDYNKYYKEKYEDAEVNAYTIDGSSLKKEDSAVSVPLNFVRSATRSENIIYAEVLFDDRIAPGCVCSIKANAVMGKRFGSKDSATKGSRILNYSGNKEPIKFRNTGKIEYLFSTTEDCYMKLQGPVVSESSTS